MKMIRVSALLAVALATAPAASSGVIVRDVAGSLLELLAPAPRDVQLLFFLSTDCPISNRYAPEIIRLCGEYSARGVRCFAVYPDAVDAATVKHHRQEFGFPETIAAIIDREHQVVRAVGPRVTPEAAIYTAAGRVYRGRIDDLYLDVGRSRRAATTHDVRLTLEAVIGGRPVSQPETEGVGCLIPKP
jgi:hypothetical protein